MDTGWISDRRSRGAWVGAAAYFLLTGVIFATWASRVPAIKGGLNFGEGQFATALLGLEAGAVLGLQLGGLLVPRVGSRRALTASLVAFACALSGLAFAPGLPLLAASARHRRGRQRSRRGAGHGRRPGVDPRLSRLLRRSRTRGGPGEPVQPAPGAGAACPAGPGDGFRGEGGQAGRIECPRGKR